MLKGKANEVSKHKGTRIKKRKDENMFKPMLAPNDIVNIQHLDYPLFASEKLDGVRGLFIRGKLHTRKLKKFANMNLEPYFSWLLDYTRKHNCILDGEIFSREIPFVEISGICRSKNKAIPSHLKFYCFDLLTYGYQERSFWNRTKQLTTFASKVPKKANFVQVTQYPLRDASEADKLYRRVLSERGEGLMLRSLLSKYKHGRATVSEGTFYKLKPYEKFTGVIQEVLQATVVDPKAEKTITELGRSRTSKKKGDRIKIEQASAFRVKWRGKIVDPILPMTVEEKKEVWKKRKSYEGKKIEFLGMMVGAVDTPRHPQFIRFI